MKKFRMVYVLAAIVVCIFLVYFVVSNNSKTSNSKSPGDTSTVGDDRSDTDSVKEGVMECLKAEGEPTTLECAYGLRTDQGETYALRIDDFSIVSKIPMGERVRVSGPITEEATKYGTVGTIRVEQIEKL